LEVVKVMSRLKKYSFVAEVESELRKLGVEYIKEVEGEAERVKFVFGFLLALDCYMPGVAKRLFDECKEDIKMFGFEYAQKKWSRFVVGSLTGIGDTK
jgi:hypothetical protein